MVSTLNPTVPLSFAVNEEEDLRATGGAVTKSTTHRTYLRQRIYKSSGADAAIAAALRREAAQKRRAEEKLARVQLFRSYRSGELPDIEGVKVSGFLAPLAQMAAADTSTACLVVSILAQSMVEAAQSGQLEMKVCYTGSHDAPEQKVLQVFYKVPNFLF